LQYCGGSPAVYALIGGTGRRNGKGTTRAQHERRPDPAGRRLPGAFRFTTHGGHADERRPGRAGCRPGDHPCPQLQFTRYPAPRKGAFGCAARTRCTR
jgi:hypothetical protein